MNTSPCTSNTEGDAPQLTSKETRPEARYASNPAGAFQDPKPHTAGRDPVWTRGGYGMPYVGSPAPRASRIAALQHEERTKNEREITRERCKTRVKSRCVLRLCVVQSAVTLRYIRGSWTFRARKRLGFTSKTLVKFGLVLSKLSKTVRFKLAAPCGSFLRS